MKKYLLIALLMFSTNSFALTETEEDLLKAAILAEPTIEPCVTNGDDVCVANWLNSASTFTVWKTRLSKAEIYGSSGWDYSLIDSLTQGKRDEWKDFLVESGFLNPSLLNNRNGIIDVWSGTAAKVAVQTAILNLSKRFATNAEKTLATGTGTVAVPGNLTFEGNINVNSVSTILDR